MEGKQKGVISLQQIPLSGLPDGQTGYLSSVALPEQQRRRLADVGLCEGAAICRRFTAPGGSPVAFGVKGALIALRRADCDRIFVRRDG